MTISLRAVMAAAALAFGTTGAQAALIDFTAGTGTVAGKAGQANFTLTAGPAGGSFTFAPDGPGATPALAAAGLAGDNDGLGIGDDEIGRNGEFVTITFDRAVTLTDLYFLDLFRGGAGGPETAVLHAGTTPSGTPLATFAAVERFGAGRPGFGAFSGDFSGTTFTISAGAGNDGIGIGDFALAGLELVPVPLPAGALLLGTALLGLGLRSRRR